MGFFNAWLPHVFLVLNYLKLSKVFMMVRLKDREFWALGMIAGTKDHEGSVAITVLSIPLFKFLKIGP